jgi:hypothetical protein
MPTLERYRFVKRIKPPADIRLNRETDTIYEALPALYHYNAGRLSRSITEGGNDFDESSGDSFAGAAGAAVGGSSSAAVPPGVGSGGGVSDGELPSSDQI